MKITKVKKQPEGFEPFDFIVECEKDNDIADLHNILKIAGDSVDYYIDNPTESAGFNAGYLAILKEQIAQMKVVLG